MKKTRMKNKQSTAIISILFSGIFVFALILFATIRTTKVLQLGTGKVVLHYSCIGIRVFDRDYDLLVHSLLPHSPKVITSEELVIDDRWFLEKGPGPSSYAGRLVSECQILKQVLMEYGATKEECLEVWLRVISFARDRKPISEIIDPLIENIKRESD